MRRRYSNLWSGLSLLVLFSLLGGCGNFSLPTPPPIDPPTATAVTAEPAPTESPLRTPPAPAGPAARLDAAAREAHPSRAPLIVHFREPVDAESAEHPLSFSPAAVGRFIWDDTRTMLVFTAEGGFSPGHEYEVALDPQLRTAAGERIAASPWAFEISPAPRVSAVRAIDRAGESHALSERLAIRRPTIEIGFDRPMDEERVVDALEVEPHFAFDASWEDNRLALDPKFALRPGEEYEIRLSTGAVDATGTPISEKQTWRLRTQPLIGQIIPPREEMTAPIEIHFNYAVEPESVEAAFRIEPEVPGTFSWNAERTRATFEPTRPLTIYTDFTLSFLGTLYDAEGDSMRPPDSYAFSTPPPIVDAGPTGSVHPATQVRLTFDRPMDEASTAEAFRITPEVTGTVEWEETTLIFHPAWGSFKEHTLYTATVTPDALTAEGEPLLPRPYAWSFRTTEYRRAISFGDGPNAQVLDADGRRAIHYLVTLEEREPVSVTFALHRLTLTQFLDRYSSGFKGVAGRENLFISTEGAPEVRSWSESVRGRGEGYYGSVHELTVPEDVPPGLYILNAEYGVLNDQLILVLSRNTLLLKQAEGQIISWVSDVNGEPQQRVQVGIYARDGELLGRGTTDAQGVFRTSVPVNPEPLIVVAQEGDDVTASGLAPEWQTGGYYGWWNPAPVLPDYAVYLYTDRPIYRPGHTVAFKAIVRRDEDAVLSRLPAGNPATVRIRDARNNVVRTFETETNAYGTLHGTFDLAEGAMTGEYTVEVVIDGEPHRQIFKVEEYRKPDYEVEVTPSRERIVSGDTVSITVESAYYFGEPVANASIKVRQIFGGPNSWMSTYGKDVEGRTDAEGRFTFQATLSEGAQDYAGHYRNNTRRRTYGFEATVDDGSHQTVSGFGSVDVFNTAEKISLQRGGYLHKPGNDIPVTAVVRNVLNDEPIAGRKLTLSLRRWDRGTHDYDNVVWSVDVTTDDAGQIEHTLVVDEPGFYQLRIHGTDRLGYAIVTRSYLLIYEHSYSRWYGAQEHKITVRSDRESYAPGDTARIFIESDVEGPALLTFERGTTRREQLVELTPPLTVVEVPVRPDDVPNVYVTVNVWQSVDTALENVESFSLADSELLQASAQLNVPADHKALTVTLETDARFYAPRDTATVTLRTVDHQGEPVPAELSLALVDDAIFALSEELSGPIFQGFYAMRRRIVRTYHSMALERWLYTNGMGGGGGEGPPPDPRSDFPDTALWIPELRTDANGVATVTLTLPDTLTRWRLTARAVTLDTQVGEARETFVTRQPVVVRPLLPRFLTTGDSVTLEALVRNDGTAPLTLTVAISETGGALLAFDDRVTRTLHLQPGEQQNAGWQVDAEDAGETHLVVWAYDAAGDAVADAVQLPLAVHPLAILDVTTTSGQFREAITLTAEHPSDVLPVSYLHLELSRSIAGTLLEGLEYLTGFPYGCVEQTMSRALPNAVVGRAFNRLGVVDPTLQADLPAKINASVQRLYGFQHNDGGWGWWYDDASHPYQTAWVVFGLSTTAEAGYEVDPTVIERGVVWLQEHLEGMDPRTRAYALYTLAVAGSPNVTATLAMTDTQTLDVFSRAGLALALHEAGEEEAAHAVVDALAEEATRRDGLVYWKGEVTDGYYDSKTLASQTRSTALALSAFVTIRPEHPYQPEIVRWLMAQRRNHGWGTTNETSYAIIALTDHLEATSYSDAAATTPYSVALGDELIVEGTLGKGEPAVSLEIPMGQLEVGENPIRIVGEGPTPLYYVLSRRLYRPENPVAAAGYVSVTRTYVNVHNEPIDEIAAGQLVKVQVTVEILENVGYVMVEDYLPGGLEALNERLNTTSYAAEDEYVRERDRFRWIEYGYNHKEVRDDRVTFFVTEMGSGTHTYTYLARATRAGRFVALPAQVSSMYDPTIWGRSASGTLRILQREGRVAAR